MTVYYAYSDPENDYESSREEKNSINIKKRYPISTRYPWMIALPWFGALIGFAIVFAGTDVWARVLHPHSIPFDKYYYESWIVLISLTIVLISKLTYGFLYRKSYAYQIQGDVLTVTRGVILKRRVSISLAREPDVYVGRRWRHFLLGLYYVDVVTPASKNSSFIRIDGLVRDTAYALQQYLVRKINTAYPHYMTRSMNPQNKEREREYVVMH